MKSALDSRQLLAARVLADTGSFTLAGRQLCLTQSAVSHAIKALEEEVECRLFLRTGKGVKLTPAGKHFLEYADTILEQMETVRMLVTARSTSGKERLRLGVSNRARHLILPVVQPLFQRDFPGRLVLIPPGNYWRNIELLDSGLLDLSFIVKPEGRADLEFVPLFDDELRFIVSAQHPWARAGRVLPDDLARDALVLYHNFNNTTFLLHRHLQNVGLAVRGLIQLTDLASILAMVERVRAVGVLSPFLVNQGLRDGRFVALPIGAQPLVRTWGLAYPGHRTLGPMEQRLVELCRQAVPGILSRLQGLPEPADETREDPDLPMQLFPKMAIGGL